MKELKLIVDDTVSLRESVYRTLREAILTDVLQPGERLMELKLAAQLGVSRTPVREAIHLLERDGLVKQEPYKGVMVAQITRKQLRDVLEVRGMLEEFAVQLACERGQEEDMQCLREAEENFCQGILRGASTPELAELDIAFHDVIYQMADNEKLIEVVGNLQQQIYRYRVEYLKGRERLQQLTEEHREMTEAICGRDVKSAVRAAVSHISNQEKAIEEELEREEAK